MTSTGRIPPDPPATPRRRLGALASRLAGAEDAVEAAALREEIVQGFYAAPVHA